MSDEWWLRLQRLADTANWLGCLLAGAVLLAVVVGALWLLVNL